MEQEKELLPKIAVDLMGCDTEPEEILKWLIPYSIKKKDTVRILALATEEVFEKFPSLGAIERIIVEEFITMTESPAQALRSKKKASTCIGIKGVHENHFDAFVSAGNTGALFGAAMWILPTLPGISKPALLVLLPTEGRPMAVLDVGANPNWKAKNLVQYASMGLAFQKASGVSEPTVGLLNIGVEASKGPSELIEVYEKLQSLNVNRTEDTKVFIGNVEGRDAFSGKIDVLVTDGFTGNVFLKTSEGICLYVLENLEKNASEDCTPYFKALLEKLRTNFSYTEYPGAILCGVDGIIVKIHGHSSGRAFESAIEGTITLIKNDFLEKIKLQLHADARLHKLSSL